MERMRESIKQLIFETATNLPSDVRQALVEATAREPLGTRAALALQAIARNVDMAQTRCGLLCQDTGLPTFHVKLPPDVDQFALSADIAAAVAESTRLGKLCPNSVDSLTGRNSGNNLGPGTPVVHFEQWLSEDIEMMLILKGGGTENVSAQYSLPCEPRRPGPRGPRSGGRAQVHPARGASSAGASVQRGHHRRGAGG